mgnify:CR=1 FL=1
MEKDIKDLKILIDTQTLENRIKQLAEEINNSYNLNETLHLICVLRGAVMFFTQLSKYLKMPVKMDFISLSSYGDSQSSSGKVKSLNLSLPNFKNENVLIVEDIVDTGLTIQEVINYLHDKGAASIEIATLLDKPESRKVKCQKPKWVGTTIGPEFVVGFGLDYDELYRNLDYVGVLKKSVYEK